MAILIFKTNIRSVADLRRVRPFLDNDARIRCWNIDQDDIDCVLRVETSGMGLDAIIDLVRKADYDCAELED